MFVAILLLGGLIEALRPHAAPVDGRPEVVDGDTLRFGALRVRLTGLDASELDQTCVGAGGVEWSCGMPAKDLVAALVGSAPVTCAGDGRDQYGRALTNCTADGGDLRSQIVNAGWAVADGRYLGEQVAARLAGRGIWAGNFVLPAEWRRDHGTVAPGLRECIRSWFQWAEPNVDLRNKIALTGRLWRGYCASLAIARHFPQTDFKRGAHGAGQDRP